MTPKRGFAPVAFDELTWYLDHLAFGVRHRPAGATQPTVHEIAHRRLNG